MAALTAPCAGGPPVVQQLSLCCVDDTSRAALAGPSFLREVRARLAAAGIGGDAFNNCDASALAAGDDAWRPMQAFATAVEVVVRYLAARRLKGNAFAMPRTFHVVDLLSRLVGLAGQKLGREAPSAAAAGASASSRSTGRALDGALDKAAARLARSWTAACGDNAAPSGTHATVESLVAAVARAGSRMGEAGWAALVGDTVAAEWLPHIAAAMSTLHGVCKAAAAAQSGASWVSLFKVRAAARRVALWAAHAPCTLSHSRHGWWPRCAF